MCLAYVPFAESAELGIVVVQKVERCVRRIDDGDRYFQESELRRRHGSEDDVYIVWDSSPEHPAVLSCDRQSVHVRPGPSPQQPAYAGAHLAPEIAPRKGWPEI